MLYIFYGSNRKVIHDKAMSLVTQLRERKPDATYTSLPAEDGVVEKITEFADNQGLFKNKNLVFCSGLSSVAKNFTSLSKILTESPNVFVLAEEKLDAKTITALKKIGAKISEHNKEDSKIPFKIFTLGDAFGRRNKKELWALFLKAIEEGISAEEIHGVLFWQLKSMVVARGAETPEKAGLHPFVFKKSLSFAKNFTESELKSLSSKMVKFYHDARRGGTELELAIEKFILSI